jgi:hypothetical protein
MSSALDLVVLNGARMGDVVQLKPQQPLKLGRSLKGYQLIDPLVSLSHAEIAWEGDCYWLQDMGSATGTFLNDQRLADKPVMLAHGMRIRLGDTVLEVRARPKAALMRMFGIAVAILVVMVSIQQYRANIVVDYDPTLKWHQAVHQGGAGDSSRIDVPVAFIRETGVDNRGLKIDKVTDYDHDGVDEVWLSWKTGQRVITFLPDGGWRTIADLPMDCKERPRAGEETLPAECFANSATIKSELPEVCKQYGQATTFPDLDCSGATWRFTGAAYTPIAQEGVVVWMPPTKDVKDDAKSKEEGKDVFVKEPDVGYPVPFLFTLTRAGQLGGFLAERGINEPIHYLVCEDALPGMKPQVLTQSGEFVVLPVGCLGAIDLMGPKRATEFLELRPKMIAFSATGYRRLVSDLAVFLTGADDDSLMSSDKRKRFENIRKVPERRQGSYLLSFAGDELLTSAIAGEGPIPVSGRLQVSELVDSLPPRAYSITLDEARRYDIEGCGDLEVTAEEWHCSSSKGCSASDTFMVLKNPGCGTNKELRVPYKSGKYTFKDGFIEGVLRLETAESARQIDALRVRFTYTPLDPSGSPDAGSAGAGAEADARRADVEAAAEQDPPPSPPPAAPAAKK